MSEQPLSANPEYLFHYQRLRRDRALMRRRAYMLLIAAGVLLTFTVFWAITVSSNRTLGPGLYISFIGFAVLLIGNGLVALMRSRQPIKDGEVARQRQEERRQLFQFAQGRFAWRYWLTVAIQFLIGILFLWFSIEIVWSLVTNPRTLAVVDILLGFAFLLIVRYSLSQAIRGVRMLRRLTKLSSQELAARLSLGEVTEGE